MRKTLLFLIVTALLGMVAAYEVPAGKSMASTTSTGSTVQASSTATQPSSSTTGQYKDGTYTGSVASNRFDEIQVVIIVSSGKISNVTTPILVGDSDQSDSINSYAAPKLAKQVLNTQDASIDGVSGASATSQSYIESLQSALDQAMA